MRDRADKAIPTFDAALAEYMSVDDLNVLAKQIDQKLLTGKADLATLIAHDSRTRKHCMLAGERHLVVPGAWETAFRRALRDVGYLVATGEARCASSRRQAAGKKAEPQADAPSSITNRE